jgi:hypothetical protein
VPTDAIHAHGFSEERSFALGMTTVGDSLREVASVKCGYAQTASSADPPVAGPLILGRFPTPICKGTQLSLLTGMALANRRARPAITSIRSV